MNKKLFSTLICGFLLTGSLIHADAGPLTQAALATDKTAASRQAQLPDPEEVTALHVVDLAQLEEASDLIVTAKMTGELRTKYSFSMGGLTPVQVDHVFKGAMTKGEELLVGESAMFNDKIPFESKSGYVPMVPEGRYILFLQKASNGSYVPVGGYQGKFNLTSNPTAMRFTCGTLTQQEIVANDLLFGNTDHFNSLKEQAITKYGHGGRYNGEKAEAGG